MAWFLTLNAGSSSLKFALFEVTGEAPSERARGQVEGLGLAPRFLLRSSSSAMKYALNILLRHFPGLGISAVGHRIVHGGVDYSEPVILTDGIFAELERLIPLAPLHQPHNLSGIAAAQMAFPKAVQIACFDTAFHRSHPWVNDTFALPRRYYDKGVRRYGFHGLSYDYVSSRLQEVAPELAGGRIIVAHLGNGASLCAIREGQSIASTMGFSPLDGLPMGTRCGQIDPGVLLYLMEEEGLTSKEIANLLYKESGLKGLSNLSSDMRELENAGTSEARQAIEYFIFRVRSEIGAMAAALSGFDALVFCGGIGEHARHVREQICANMDWLGLRLNAGRNQSDELVISSDDSKIKVLVISTNEELAIARHMMAILH